ncbi:MAG: AsmA family protein [Rhodospirillales bacterium]|nr:MAG: AsmA family protein [Rhodospirillales bacterium]
MRILKIIGIVAAGVVALLVAVIVGAVIVLNFLDFNAYKPVIADAVRNSTGRELVIAGDLRVEISFTPGIVAEGVTLSNAEWGSRPEMVAAQRLEIHVAPLPLIYGSLQIRRIELTGADVLLETDADGRANFAFAMQEDAPEELRPQEEARDGFTAVPLILEARVRESRLTYVNGATGVTRSAAFEAVTLNSGGRGAPLKLDVAASYNDVPLRAEATLGAMSDLIAPNGPWPVDLAAEGGGAKLTVAGTIAEPLAGAGLDLAVSLNGAQTGDLSGLLGSPLPELGAYALSGRLTGDLRSTLELGDLKTQLGTSDLAGSATASLAGPRPVIDAKLLSKKLDLAGLGTGVNASLVNSAATLSLTGRTLTVARFSTRLAGGSATASGTVADVFELAGMDLSVSASGDRFTDLSQLAGTELPALGAYSISGRLRGDVAGTIDVSGLVARLGESDVAGSATVSPADRGHMLRARLSSNSIDLPALGVLDVPLRDAATVVSLKDKTLTIESFRATLSGAAIDLSGAIADPAAAAGLDLSVTAKGRQIADLAALAGMELPELGAYSVTGRLNGNPRETLRATNIAARLGESDLRGRIAVTLSGDRPGVDADLSSDRIDLVSLGAIKPTPGDGATGQPAAEPKPDRLFPDDPLELEWLNAADVTIRYGAATVIGRQPLMRDAAIALSLQHGLLEVESVRAVLQNGILDGAVRIDGRKKATGWAARIALKKVDLAVLMAQTAQAGAIQGQINLEFDLTARGNSIRQIMAGLDGHVLLAMGKGQIRSRTLQTWVGGPTQVLSNVLTLNMRGNTAVNCAMASFYIKQGLATSDGLLLDTDVAAFVGKGNVNLKTEAVDVIIDPKVKRLTLSAAVPVHIRGTLMRPTYTLDERAVALRVGGLLGGLIYPPALIIGLGELGTFRDGDCVGVTAVPEDPGAAEQPAPTTEPGPTRLPGRILQGTGDSITRGLQRLFGE